MADPANIRQGGDFDFQAYSDVLDEQFKADGHKVMEGLRGRVLNSQPKSAMETFAWRKWACYNEQLDIRLPGYSIPVRYGVPVPGGRMPAALTCPSGKVDLMALPHGQTAESDRIAVLATPGSEEYRKQQMGVAINKLEEMSKNLPPEKDHISRLAADRWGHLYIELHRRDPDFVIAPALDMAECDDPTARNLREAARRVVSYFGGHVFEPANPVLDELRADKRRAGFLLQ